MCVDTIFSFVQFYFFLNEKEKKRKQNQEKMAKINVLLKLVFVTKAENYSTEHCSGGSRIFQRWGGGGEGPTAEVGAETFLFQWRVQDFPGEGVLTPKVGALTYYFAIFFKPKTA